MPRQMTLVQRKMSPTSPMFEIYTQNQHQCVYHHVRQLSVFAALLLAAIAYLAMLFIFQVRNTASSVRQLGIK